MGKDTELVIYAYVAAHMPQSWRMKKTNSTEVWWRIYAIINFLTYIMAQNAQTNPL